MDASRVGKIGFAFYDMESLHVQLGKAPKFTKIWLRIIFANEGMKYGETTPKVPDSPSASFSRH